MISHKSRDVAISNIKQLAVIVQTQAPLTITRCKVHKYLDMALDLIIKCKSGCQDGRVLLRYVE
jgi:hypothetical protein